MIRGGSGREPNGLQVAVSREAFPSGGDDYSRVIAPPLVGLDDLVEHGQLGLCGWHARRYSVAREGGGGGRVRRRHDRIGSTFAKLTVEIADQRREITSERRRRGVGAGGRAVGRAA
eukprot:4620647-Prymnesium_polylepis.1